MARRFTRGLALRPVNSNKNVVELLEAVTTANSSVTLAIAKDNPVNTVEEEVGRGSTIRNMFLSFDVCGLAGAGAVQRTNVYLMKNPGSNLTAPGAFTVGTSNEKKFVFRQWSFMTMRNQDGNPPFHFEGWVKIPKRYTRMGADDKIILIVATDTLTGHFTGQCIYKWFQ